MIRTNSVKLTSLANATACRRKSTSGGSAIVIVRADEPQPGIAAMAELIDEVSPKGAFKELKAKVRQMKGEAKR